MGKDDAGRACRLREVPRREARAPGREEPLRLKTDLDRNQDDDKQQRAFPPRRKIKPARRPSGRAILENHKIFGDRARPRRLRQPPLHHRNDMGGKRRRRLRKRQHLDEIPRYSNALPGTHQGNHRRTSRSDPLLPEQFQRYNPQDCQQASTSQENLQSC